MVGDPKQAIYRFRGGDLDTYRRARDQADQRFGLRRNFRATPALVSALNTLMAPGLPRSRLPVPAVEACSGRSGAQAAPIELIWLGRKRAAGEPLPSGSELEDRLSDLVAGHTADLLTQKEPLWRPSDCLLYTSPSPRDVEESRMPSSA